MSQEAVAEIAGISPNHLQLLEAGLGNRGKRTASNPRLKTLIGLSRALDTTVPELIDHMFERTAHELPGTVTSDASLGSSPPRAELT